MTVAGELGERERTIMHRLLRAEVTAAEAARQAGVSKRELVGWRRAYLASKVPPRDAQLTLAVNRPVTVRWDRWGVPHIGAETLHDLYFGLGYAMAQERLWQLDWLRRSARGQCAAVLGRSAFDSDRAIRIIGLGRAADEALAALSEDEATMLGGLTDGINAWLDQAGERLPIEFDILDYTPAPWRVSDSIAVWKYAQWLLTGRLENISLAEAARRNLSSDLLPAFLATEAGQETIVPVGGAGPGAPGQSSGVGSNNWAVAPRRTVTGAAVLAGDPHQPFHQPNQHFEFHLHGAGIDAAGAVHVGTVVSWYGRNRQVAWAVTNHSVSSRDIYIEEVEPGDSNRYREGEVWRAFLVEEEAIDVRGEKTEYISVRRTVRGPIVSALVPELEYWSGPPLALRWVGYEPATGMQAVLGLLRAETVNAAREALRGWVLPPFNFVLADTGGQIAYQVAGQVPRRGDARRGYRKPAEPADAWGEPVPFEELPHEVDPTRGWVATANNPPWGPEEPWVRLGVWADGYRMRRIRERLEEREQHTVEQIAAIQADIVHARAADLGGRVAWWLRQTGEPPLMEMARWLSEWDHAYDTNSVAATIFETFWQVWLQEITAAQLPSRLTDLMKPQAGAVAREVLLGRRMTWFSSGTVREHVRAAGREALKQLEAVAGPDMSRWRWGRLHRVSWPHVLADRPGLRRLTVGPFPTSGTNSTVRAAWAPAKPPFTSSGGSTYRLVVDLADAVQAWSVLPAGQSGHVGSPHYRDQARLWLANEYKPLWLDLAAVDENLEGMTRIEPADTRTSAP